MKEKNANNKNHLYINGSHIAMLNKDKNEDDYFFGNYNLEKKYLHVEYIYICICYINNTISSEI